MRRPSPSRGICCEDHAGSLRDFAFDSSHYHGYLSPSCAGTLAHVVAQGPRVLIKQRNNAICSKNLAGLQLANLSSLYHIPCGLGLDTTGACRALYHIVRLPNQDRPLLLQGLVGLSAINSMVLVRHARRDGSVEPWGKSNSHSAAVQTGDGTGCRTNVLKLGRVFKTGLTV